MYIQLVVVCVQIVVVCVQIVVVCSVFCWCSCTHESDVYMYCVMAVVLTVGYVTFHIAHSLLWFLVRNVN